MNRKLYSKIAILTIFFSALFGDPFVVKAYDISSGGGLNTAANKAFGATAKPFAGLTLATLPGKAGEIIGGILAFVGLIFFVLLIYSGLLWMTARGKDAQIADAQKIMRSATIGLIIVLCAYIITAFVGRILT